MWPSPSARRHTAPAMQSEQITETNTAGTTMLAGGVHRPNNSPISQKSAAATNTASNSARPGDALRRALQCGHRKSGWTRRTPIRSRHLGQRTEWTVSTQGRSIGIKRLHPSSPLPTRPLHQVQEIPSRLRTVGQEVRIRLGPVVGPRDLDLVAAEMVAQHVGFQSIRLQRIQAQDLSLDLRRQGRIAVAILEFLADLERSEGLDLVLWRAVPDRIGAPQDVVLAEVQQQLAQRVRGRVGVAHQEAPGRAEFGVDVAALQFVLDDGLYERIDALAALGVVGAFGLAGD